MTKLWIGSKIADKGEYYARSNHAEFVVAVGDWDVTAYQKDPKDLFDPITTNPASAPATTQASAPPTTGPAPDKQPPAEQPTKPPMPSPEAPPSPTDPATRSSGDSVKGSPPKAEQPKNEGSK